MGAGVSLGSEVSIRYRLADSYHTHGIGAVEYQRGTTATILFASRTQPTFHFSIGAQDLSWFIRASEKYANPMKRYAVKRTTGGYTVAQPVEIVFVTDSQFRPLRYEQSGRIKIEVVYSFVDFLRDDVDENPNQSPLLRTSEGKLIYRRREKRFDILRLENQSWDQVPALLTDLPLNLNETRGWYSTLEVGPQTNSRGTRVERPHIPIRISRFFLAKALVEGKEEKISHVRFTLGTGTKEYEVAESAIRWLSSEDEWMVTLESYGAMRVPNNRGRMRTQDEILYMDRRQPKEPRSWSWFIDACWKILGGTSSTKVDASPLNYSNFF